MGRHRIGRQIIEIVARDRAVAESLADRTAAAAPRLFETLARGFDAADDGAHRRIERLVLMLPPCDLASFEESFLATLADTLADALPRQLARADAIAPPEDAAALIAVFLRSGVLPWWADDPATAVPEAAETLLHAEPLAEAPPGIVTLRHLIGTADAATRLVQALPGSMLPRLAARLAALPTDGFDALALALTAEERDKDPVTAATHVWSNIVLAAAQAAPVPTLPALADTVRARLAFLGGGTGRALQSSPEPEADPSSMIARAYHQPPKPGPTAPPPLDQQLPETLSPHAAPVAPGESPAPPPPLPDPDLPVTAGSPKPDSAQPDRRDPIPDAPRAAPPDTAPTIVGDGPPAGSDEAAARVNPEHVPSQAVNAPPAIEGVVSAVASSDPTEHEKQAAQRQEEISRPEPTLPSVHGTAHSSTAARRPQDSVEQRAAGPQPAEHDSLFIEAAGIVLLGPFLPDYFAAAGLIDAERRFVTPAARHRAVTLLDYLASAERDPPEPRLALPKLLAGMPINMVHVPLPLDDDQAAAADALLAAVLAELPILGRLTVDGFRAAWLNRPGLLTVEHGGWLLRVERHGWDVLLERLPWSIAWLQLPWQPEGIRIEW